MNDAFQSFCSDLNKHPGTRNHLGLELGMQMLAGGLLRTAGQMRDWIEGFN